MFLVEIFPTFLLEPRNQRTGEELVGRLPADMKLPARIHPSRVKLQRPTGKANQFSACGFLELTAINIATSGSVNDVNNLCFARAGHPQSRRAGINATVEDGYNDITSVVLRMLREEVECPSLPLWNDVQRVRIQLRFIGEARSKQGAVCQDCQQ